MKKIILTEEDIKSISILDNVYFALLSKKVTKKQTEFDKEKLNLVANKILSTQPKDEQDLALFMAKVFSMEAEDILMPVVLLRLGFNIIKLNYQNNEILDLKEWQISNLEPIRFHYKIDQVRFEKTDTGYEFDADSLEPFDLYAKRQIEGKQTSDTIIIGEKESSEEISKKLLPPKNTNPED